MKITHFVTAFILAVLLSSCGALQKAKTRKNITKTKKTDSTAITKEVVEEKIDTNVKIKGDSTRGLYQSFAGRKIKRYGKQRPNPNEERTTVIDNKRQRVDVVTDKKTGQVFIDAIVKDQEVPVKMDRKTTKESNIHVKTEERERDKTLEKTKDQEGFFTWKMWIAVYISIGLGVLVIVILWGRKAKKKLTPI